MKNIICLLFLFGISVLLKAQSIVDTKHNLSVSGPGTVKAVTESEICLFCHTAHNSKPFSPLWNRNDPGSNYTLYNSSTMIALPSQPSGSSMLCLSCHDGTIALGSVLSRGSVISFASAVNMPAGPSNLSTDLRNDHPISFTYDAALAASNGQLKNPASLMPQIKLENNQLQCTACHDPHKNIYSDFLVASSQYSNLCNACHQPTNWTTSTHNTSIRTWNNILPNPWPYTPWTTVAENACANCHNSHNSGAVTHLLKYQTEEDNCLDCHNGNVATKNIQIEMAKPYRHNVYGYTSIHDPSEQALVNTKHVECTDCHDPHQTKSFSSSAPDVKGSSIGVKGINQNGIAITPVSFEYEICYRCHADNPATAPPTPRVIVQANTRLEFAVGNPSFHPIEAIGINTNVPSLISPYTTSSIIYCTDCHSSNGTGAPAGPHGSIYPQILKARYETADFLPYNSSNYELCFNCHSNTSILNNTTFSNHKEHIVDIKTSCNTCHDPHGISSLQGNDMNNAKLINFNTAYVSPSSGGLLKFEDIGFQSGRCFLTCHGKDHNPLTYP